jgi:uncharacterized membrane protein (DUF373 family)
MKDNARTERQRIERAQQRHRHLHFGHRQHVDSSIRLVHLIEDIVHYGVAAVLLGVSGVVLWHSGTELLHHDQEFAERVTAVVNGTLFVIIVLEILRTVVAHFEDADLQLKPFLTIGIISAVRHILTIGAQASLGATPHGSPREAQIDLALNAVVVVVLVFGLILVRRSDREYGDEEEPATPDPMLA